MRLRHIPRSAFTARPWKNGAGTTYDIALLPEGAGHHDFDLRFALSPIPAPGPFSAFPGIDRVITLVRGDALTLDFDDGREQLQKGQSLRFNSALSPHGTPAPGGVEVINVMARRGVWRIRSCAITETRRHGLTGAMRLFIVATHGAVTLNGPQGETSLAPFDAALCNGPGAVGMTGDTPALVAYLEPGTD